MRKVKITISAIILSFIASFSGTAGYTKDAPIENHSTAIINEQKMDSEEIAEVFRNFVKRDDESFQQMTAKKKALAEKKLMETKAEAEETEEAAEEIQTEVSVEDKEETKVEETQPAATKPAATQPAATKPAATQPAETKPAATQPAATQPAATQPAATQPAATKPAATQPAATKPAETKPAATKPAETPAPTTQAPAPATGLNGTQQNTLTNYMAAAINNVRAGVGMPGLNLDGSLVSIAAVRSNEASVLWSHTRPNGGRGIDMIPSNKWRGENLSKVTLGGFDGSDAQLAALAQRIVNNWVASSGHYANLVGANFTNIGLYTYVVTNGNTCTLYTAAMFSN